MEIVNNSDINVSWFVYNQQDALKWIALGSGDLDANGGRFSYTPPKNSNDLYFVRFTYEGGGTELAGGIVKRTGETITLEGSNDHYHAVVTSTGSSQARQRRSTKSAVPADA